ncbi:MAG: enoyl-CoA hydratase/isomerase family protein [bacterium]|nr:enoyl-CoA hydratase/isomerase family protein [bacterium]
MAVVTLSRPEARNPLDAGTVKAMRSLLEGFVDAGDVDSVIVTGSGDSFSAGGDLKGYQTLFRDQTAFSYFLDDFEAVCDVLERSRLISVAMINGTCVAGGLELALACDVITIADDARIGDGHLNFAQLPGAGSSQRLIRAIGVQRAKHWLLSGRLFEPSEAVEAGLALLVSPQSELRSKTLDIVADLCRTSPLARQRMKELIAYAQRSLLQDGLAEEQRVVFEYATTSHDATEGLNAFAERRQPDYKGR